MQGEGLMKTEKVKKARELEKENCGRRQVHCFVKCFNFIFNFPFLFVQWLANSFVELPYTYIKPGEIPRFERTLLFISFLLLCFGFYRLLSTLIGNYLSHDLFFTEYKAFMVEK